MIPTNFDGLTTEGFPPKSYEEAVWTYRRALVRRALRRHKGNRTRAARELGISRQAIRYLHLSLRIEEVPR